MTDLGKHIVSDVFLEDCMVGMKRYEDKFFDLAVVDPIYGHDISGGHSSKNGWGAAEYWDKATDDWNTKKTEGDYFKELFRVSKNQIVWGGNYFIEYLYSREGWIVWDKGQRNFSLADCELAWTSFEKATRVFDFSRAKNNQTDRIHPTQKPIELYRYILENYAKEGDKILDTHVGSGSSRIAAYDMNFDFIGFEIDATYHAAQEKRFNQFKSQPKLPFTNQSSSEQGRIIQ